jgi:hypothetical protein
MVSLTAHPGDTDRWFAFSSNVLTYLDMLWELDDVQGVPRTLHPLIPGLVSSRDPFRCLVS